MREECRVVEWSSARVVAAMGAPSTGRDDSQQVLRAATVVSDGRWARAGGFVSLQSAWRAARLLAAYTVRAAHIPEAQQRALCKNEWPQHSPSPCGELSMLVAGWRSWH
jgi:hypothetical protein